VRRLFGCEFSEGRFAPFEEGGLNVCQPPPLPVLPRFAPYDGFELRVWVSLRAPRFVFGSAERELLS